MPVRKYIASLVMLMVLQQHAAHLSLIRIVDYPAIVSVAYAEDNSDPPTVPVPQQESPELSDTPAEPAGQQVPQKSIDEKEKLPPDKPAESEVGWGMGYVDRVQGGISQRVLASAEWLDSFFVDTRFVREENHSYLQLRYDLFTEKSIEETSLTPSFNLQLRLPELERLGRRISLVFESGPGATPDGAPVPASNTGAQVLPAQNRPTSAALHFLLGTTATQSFIIRTGALLNIDQSLFFISPRYRLLIPLNSWNFRFTQDVIYRTGTAWQPKTEWETETLFDLERKLPNDLFFRSYLDAIWLRNTDDYIYNIGCSLLEPLDSTRALSYGWNNRFLANPDLDLDEIRLSVQYRQSFWREWLFYEVIPQYRFPRERNFEATPGILFRLEMYFGHI